MSGIIRTTVNAAKATYGTAKKIGRAISNNTQKSKLQSSPTNTVRQASSKTIKTTVAHKPVQNQKKPKIK